MITSTRRLAIGTAIAMLLLAMAPVPGATAASRSINFDDVTAPSFFAETTPLTTAYAAKGVTFGGLAGNPGGSVLNPNTFSVTGYSGPNSLALNTVLGGAGGTLPEVLTFTSPATTVSLKAGSSQAGTMTLTAYDGASVVAETSRAAAPALATMTVQAPRITSVQVNITTTTLVIDDLTFAAAPAVTDDSYQTTRNTTLNALPGVLGNDTDADGDTLTAAVSRVPLNGTVTMFPNGSFSYVPATGFVGADGFDYAASDGTNTRTGHVTITVTGPIAAADRCTNLSGLQASVPAGTKADAAGVCRGTSASARLTGGSGVDVFSAGGGNDRVSGLGGNDVLNGGPGNDVLVGGKGVDVLNGGPGRDTINAKDGVRGDRVSCGPGRDVAIVDRKDKTVGCEKVQRK